MDAYGIIDSAGKRDGKLDGKFFLAKTITIDSIDIDCLVRA